MGGLWTTLSQAELIFLHGLDFLRCDMMDVVMRVVTSLGNGGIIWILCTLLMLINRRYRKYGVMAAIALLIGLLLGNGIIKPLFARERPFTVDPSIQLLIAPPGDYSFPSAHTMSSFAVAVCIFFGNKKWGMAALILAGCIAFSRMYLMVHFPSDVLAGLFLGILFAWAARWLTGCLPFFKKDKRSE